MAPVLQIKRLAGERDGDIPLPAYQTPESAGADLRAAISTPLIIDPGHRCLVPTGLAFELPLGWEAQVRPRSGLALRDGMTVLNSPGTIDSDYRGEVKVILVNLGHEPVTIHRGDRIAQIVVAPVAQAEIREVTELSSSDRGAGGFGHTGRS